MLLHQPRVLLVVHAEAALARELLRQLDREAVRRLQVERVVAGDLALRRRLLEDRHAALERLAEALLLGGEHAVDLVAVLDELRIRRAHLLDHDVGEAGQERRLHPDAQAVLRRAADDAAQDVAAPLVRRRDALGGDERHAAAVVGEHAVRLRRVVRGAVRDAGLLRDPVHDQLVAVGVVDGRHLLHDARDALEPPAGVDVLARQVGERAVGVQLVRHEDEVPELEEALAARAAGQAVVGRSPTSAPQSQYISESGPHGPGPPTDQKFSDDGSGTIRSAGIPIRSQRPIASSSGPSFSPGSPAWTLTQTRSQSSFSRSWMNSVAYSIAPSLKYWPNEKLPSISKNVRWNVSSPTSSMSGVRKTFWHVVVSGAGGVSRPRKNGICGCMPALV